MTAASKIISKNPQVPYLSAKPQILQLFPT